MMILGYQSDTLFECDKSNEIRYNGGSENGNDHGGNNM